MLHGCNAVCCVGVMQYVAQVYCSMLHRCNAVCCTGVMQYVAQVSYIMLHKCNAVCCTCVRVDSRLWECDNYAFLAKLAPNHKFPA